MLEPLLRGALVEKVHDSDRVIWSDLEYLRDMDNERLLGLGLEPLLTTSELADYLGVHAQAIYDLRTDGRGPSGIRVGREIRYRVSDVCRWLDGLHEPERSLSGHGAEL
ncbi:excisionase family DNA binding protein [Cryobacterium sp. CAN_C3]|uniref:helix-turn-helix transcriptional regulator n=1 Tax=unclassified Cryobacterium TaxID=2649013 RepID=UPI001A19A345|nr:excisionase family DNA binding protein [Cryobacterium sp. CAN_C3]